MLFRLIYFWRQAHYKAPIETIAQLNEGNKYINSDPLIDEELRKCHDVFLCPDKFDYKKKTFIISR